ncbi:MAG: choice-of-anchor D domain-containing protein [Myxococcales bacterium]|nr:choice-of-anchor D domain-containing protein [Myxococcales bacterium]
MGAVAWACAGAVACSDTTDGGGSSGTGGASEPSKCQGQTFCLEDDRQIAVDPAQLAFSDIEAGKEQTLPLRVTHTGKGGTLKVTAATFEVDTSTSTPASAAQEFSVVGFKPLALVAGASATLAVKYTPTATGAKVLRLLLPNNAADAKKQKLAVDVRVQAAGASMKIAPAIVDFGNVAANVGAEQTALVINNGTVPIDLASIQLSKSGSGEFSIAQLPDFAKPIPPDGSVKVVLRYQPVGGDSDETTMQVEGKSGIKAIATLLGNEIAPNIVVVPPKLQFGALAKGATVARPLKIANTGLAKLEIAKFDVIPPAMAGSIKVSQVAPFGIDPVKDIVVQVSLTLAETKKNDGGPVASLVIHSNDPGEPQLSVPLYAQSDAPKLQVTPDDYVDFSIVAKSLTTTRKVTLFNAGTALLTVKSIQLTNAAGGEFAITPGAFAPTDKTPTAGTIEGGKSAEFDVTFTNKGGATQQVVKGELVIESNDADKPKYPLGLIASRADVAECKVMLIPGTLNFGVMPYGMQKSLPLGLKNIGSGYCVFDKVKITECSAASTLPGFPLPAGPPKCTTAGTDKFKSFAPATKLFNLGPGEQGQLQIEFTAPETLGMFGGGKANMLTEFHGLVVVDFKDAATGLVVSCPPIKVFDPTAVAKAAPNLIAKVGKGQVQVLPGDVDFGVVTVGCKSKIEKVQVFNTGTTEVNVTKVELFGCGPEVEGKGWPAIPKTGLPIKQAAPLEFGVQYGPQNVGKDQCQVNVYTGLQGTCVDKANVQLGTQCESSADCKATAGDWCQGQLFTVPLQGVGTLDDEFTDVFEQGDGKKVDVLFVIDNSGSMGEEQKNLVDNFKSFIQIASIWKNDYHLGVVTTDMEAASQSGRLQVAGGLSVITPKSANPTGSFQALAKQGTNGSGNEQGLAAAEAALTAPLVTDLAKACNTDADCQKPAVCVPGADDGIKMCGGPNRTFLRKNIGLEVVIVSDEEDSSGNTPNYFVNAFYALKGLANKNLFHLHAIVGDENGGCKGAGGEADAGKRYIAVAKATGGKIGSICDPNFAKVLQDIGTVAFGLQAQFYLTRTPDPSTFVVKVNGGQCPQGANSWLYDAASNSVTFNENGTCMPQKGHKVTIYYKMLCFP